MTRLRVTDRTTGEPLDELEPAAEGTARPASRGERPIVIRAAPGPGARGRIPFEVVVGGWRFELEVEDAERAELRQRATAGRAAVLHDGPTEVRAIIPGRVVSVAVAAGDAVAIGQRLLAVEAMKMENELRAPRDGTIERVAVSIGQTVELGDPLVVIR